VILVVLLAVREKYMGGGEERDGFKEQKKGSWTFLYITFGDLNPRSFSGTDFWTSTRKRSRRRRKKRMDEPCGRGSDDEFGARSVK